MNDTVQKLINISSVITMSSPSVHAEQQEPNPDNHLAHRTYVELYHHGLHHIKSSALLCAVGLGIPGAIHCRGGVATISDLVTDTGVHPAKRSHLRRLMRMLACFGIFGAGEQRVAAAADDDGESETVYKLTPVSSVLVGDDKVASGTASLDMSALLRLLARPSTSVSTFFGLEEWFRDGGTTTLFEMALGVPPWILTKNDATYNRAMNEACVVDTNMAMGIMLKDTCRGGGASSIFSGLSSLVDVGGGHGAAAMAIAMAFPHIKCSVLDLEQVIVKVPAGTDHVHSTVQFIAGDMFESIPPTDAVFLKVNINIFQ
jgi:Ca2+-transporting ATPase